MPVRVSQTTSRKGDLLGKIVPETLPQVFNAAQLSTANHRKNVTNLHKLFLECAAVTEEVNGGVKLTGEKAFKDTFIDMVNRVLPIKKGVVQADRAVKFVAAFVAFAVENSGLSPFDRGPLNLLKYRPMLAVGSKSKEEGEGDDDEEDDDDSPASRLVSSLLRHLLKGFNAKDKNIRLRCCQVVQMLINGLGELE